MDYEAHVEFTTAVQGSNSDDEFYRRAEIAKDKAKRLALEAALKFTPSIDGVVEGQVPTVFGMRWEKRISQIQNKLIDRYGEATNELIKLADRCFEYSKQEAAGMIYYLLQTGQSSQKDNSWTHLSTPDGYANHEGWAYTAYNGVISSIEKPKELLCDTLFNDYPSDADLLEANGLFWFCQAARLQHKGDPSALDVLFECADAFELANGIYMWNEGNNLGIEEARQSTPTQTRNAAATLAKKRHAENYALIGDALKYWRESPRNQ